LHSGPGAATLSAEGCVRFHDLDTDRTLRQAIGDHVVQGAGQAGQSLPVAVVAIAVIAVDASLDVLANDPLAIAKAVARLFCLGLLCLSLSLLLIGSSLGLLQLSLGPFGPFVRSSSFLSGFIPFGARLVTLRDGAVNVVLKLGHFGIARTPSPRCGGATRVGHTDSDTNKEKDHSDTQVDEPPPGRLVGLRWCGL